MSTNRKRLPQLTVDESQGSRSRQMDVFGLKVSESELFGISCYQERPIATKDTVEVSTRQLQFLLQIAIAAMQPADESGQQSPLASWLAGYSAALQPDLSAPEPQGRSQCK